ncbi:cysteine--tRNA ligase, partial [bacterium]
MRRCRAPPARARSGAGRRAARVRAAPVSNDRGRASQATRPITHSGKSSAVREAASRRDMLKPFVVTLRFYNTRTQRVEDFSPRDPSRVSLYLCGLTTYDFAHAGHARTNVSFDTLVRHLRARGFEVTFVRNVTDVDDKILDRAKERGEDPLALSARMSELSDQDLAAIGCQKPTVEPRVSTHIPQIVELVEKLIAAGSAYPAETPRGTDVYFSVRSFPDYGKLSRRKIDDLRSGARVEKSDIKRDPLDFALWKGCGDEAYGWDSPWGKGRPGWHIECSAMAAAHLGPHMDIHCGGMDLIFPHHENEIAQSEAVHGAELSNFWMHGGFLEIDSEKMSKSLGNFVTIRDVLARNDAEAFRYFLLGTHYRGPLNFDLEKRDDGRVVFLGVDEAERRIEYMYNALVAVRELAAQDNEAESAEGLDALAKHKQLGPHAKVAREAYERILSALDHDLNTSVALAVLGDVAKAANEVTLLAQKALRKDAAGLALARLAARLLENAFVRAGAVLGLFRATPAEFFARTLSRRLGLRQLDPAVIEAQIQARKAAREAK